LQPEPEVEEEQKRIIEARGCARGERQGLLQET
jgi:hypothetical protein